MRKLKKAIAIGIFGLLILVVLALAVMVVVMLVTAFQEDSRKALQVVALVLGGMLTVVGIVALLVWAEKQLTGGSK